MTKTKPKILCIDDDEDTRLLVKFALEEEGFEVTICPTAEAGLVKAKEGKMGAIILDNRFKQMSGLELCQEIRRFDAETPIIFFSGESRQSEITKAISAGANSYLVKPLGFEKLSETVFNCINR